jgi:GNAT superfamily N-acetyltransferase
MAGASIVCRPLTPERWPDLVRLFGPRGACGGCWCMHWRLKRSDYERRKGNGNRRALKGIVDAGQAPGLLAYSGVEPVAWCAVAPREAFSTLERSRVLARLDDTPVWSVVCLFVARGRRGQGITRTLLRAAVEYVRRRGGQVLEGYPVEPRTPRLPDVFAFTGLASAFRSAGFAEAGRRSATRPIMRIQVA